MRWAAALILCSACFPYDASSEFVPVTVRVYNGEGDGLATIAPRPPPSDDPCDAPPPDIATCTPVATVRVRDLGREPNCYYDTKVTEGEVGRVMQCPTGSMVVFEHATFVSAKSTPSGFVDACTSTTYDFPQGDDCTWRTEQRVQGSLAGPLTFSYGESPVSGRACTLACRQHAILDVLAWSGASRGWP